MHFYAVTVQGAEFLDENFQRPAEGLQATDPATAYLRVIDPYDTQFGSITLESRRDAAVVDSGVSLAMTRVGVSPTYLGRFTIVPDGYNGSAPSGPLLHIPLGTGELVASETASAGSRAQGTGARVLPPSPHPAGGHRAYVRSLGNVRGDALKIGFACDEKISRQGEPPAPKYPNPAELIDPDDVTPIWTKSGATNDPACYQRGFEPRLFGTINITTIAADKLAGLKADVEVSEVGLPGQPARVAGTKEGVAITGTEVRFDSLDLTAPPQARGVGITNTNYTYRLRVYPDAAHVGGWGAANGSQHKIYWIEGAPKDPPFEGNSALFPDALEHACTAAAAASPGDTLGVLTKITEEVEQLIRYVPDAAPEISHPLELYTQPGSMCSYNARLLRGLFRSIGIEASPKFIWSGQGPRMWLYRMGQFSNDWRSFQVEEPKNEDGLGPNPHFTFHAVVDVNGVLFDPSFGNAGFSTLNFLTAVEQKPTNVQPPCQMLYGTSANQFKQEGDLEPPGFDAIQTDCHR